MTAALQDCQRLSALKCFSYYAPILMSNLQVQLIWGVLILSCITIILALQRQYATSRALFTCA